MVARQDTRKFETLSAQGAGSFITFRVPTWGESQEVVKIIRQTGRDYRHRGRDDGEIEKAENELLQLLWGLAESKFVDWNWVDGEGNPLPPLPEISQRDLLSPEMEAIVRATRALYGIIDLDDEKKV